MNTARKILTTLLLLAGMLLVSPAFANADTPETTSTAVQTASLDLVVATADVVMVSVKAAADDDPVDPCELDPTGPGCDPVDPCELDPNAPGCQPVDPCDTNPNGPGCQPTDPCDTLPQPEGCQPTDPCDTNPNGPGCQPTDPCDTLPLPEGCDDPGTPTDPGNGNGNPGSDNPDPEGNVPGDVPNSTDPIFNTSATPPSDAPVIPETGAPENMSLFIYSGIALVMVGVAIVRRPRPAHRRVR